MERLGREGEANAFTLQAFHQGQIDRLLDVHVAVVVRIQNVVHDFEVQAAGTDGLEMGPVEPDVWKM